MAATYVKPGELGLNPEKLTEMLTELEQTVEIHSISVRFDGKVILEGAWEPFSLEKPQMMHSLSKIGTSICLGFALDEGKIHLEDRIRSGTGRSDDLSSAYHAGRFQRMLQ